MTPKTSKTPIFTKEIILMSIKDFPLIFKKEAFSFLQTKSV